jgi:DNA-binding response OmpR family regulator
VGEANNGEDGLELFRKTNPNVVIVDFQMPGINGIEVGRRIRQTDSETLLILFSMHVGQELEEFARAAGFDAVVSKGAPFPVVGVIEAMKAKTRNYDPVTPGVPLHTTECVKMFGLKHSFHDLLGSFKFFFASHFLICETAWGDRKPCQSCEPT